MNKKKRESKLYKPDFETEAGRKEVLFRLWKVNTSILFVLFILTIYCIVVGALYVEAKSKIEEAQAETYETDVNIKKMYTLKDQPPTTSTMTIQSENRTTDISVDWEITKNTASVFGTYNINVIRRVEEKYNNNTVAVSFKFLDNGTWKNIIYMSKPSTSTTWDQNIYGFIYEKTTNVCQTDYYLSKVLQNIYTLGEFEDYTPEETGSIPNFNYTLTYIPYNIGDNGYEYGTPVQGQTVLNTIQQEGFKVEIRNIVGYQYVKVYIVLENVASNIMYKDPYLWALNFRNIMPIDRKIYVYYRNQVFTDDVEYNINDNGIPEQRNEVFNGEIGHIALSLQLSDTQNNGIDNTIFFSGQDYINGYQDAIQYLYDQKQLSYNLGYSAGVATASTGDFYHLISAVFSVPVSVITGFADVTILGVNMLTVLRSLLTLCIIAMIIKLVL